MPEPLICTVNSLGRVDYGIPIVASKSTDYRTSYKSYHQYIPQIPQEFDCRTKARIKKHLLEKDVGLKDEVKSSYNAAYKNIFQGSNPFSRPGRAYLAETIDYTRTVQEKIFKDPPRPVVHNVSDMKENYQLKYPEPKNRIVFPPDPYSLCDIKGLGRDLQPAVYPEEKGFWKWLDIYLTTNRASHVPFTLDQQNGLARKDIVTFYDASGVPPCKGFGPRNGPATEPLLSIRKEPVYDKVTFDKPAFNRIVRQPMKRVPNFGLQTEYKGRYINQTFSHMHPYLFSNGVEFQESLSEASPWQNLAPPAMYCTEYCHIGTGWSTRSVVEPGLPKKYLAHQPCCVKVNG